MPFLLTVTLNAALDKTYLVPGFALNRVHRPAQTLTAAGGKGVNVARVFQTLGGRAIATGFLGGGNGETIARRLALEGIENQFVPVVGESRVCLCILDPEAETQTEVNESGPLIKPAEQDALQSRLRELLSDCAAVVFSGSVPPGMSHGIYRDLIAMAQDEFGVRAALDTSGEALTLGVQARPFLVKPNQHELAALGIAGEDGAAAARALRAKFGVGIAVVTQGAQGAALSTKEGTWQAAPPAVAVVSALGSGDTLMAALLWANQQGETWPRALQIGVAAGAANAMTLGPGCCDKATVLGLADRTVVTQVQ